MSVAAAQCRGIRFVAIELQPKEERHTKGDGKNAGSDGSSSLAVAVEVAIS